MDGNPRNRLRLWPGVAAAVALSAARFGAPLVLPDTGGLAVMGGAIGALIILLWWAVFSRVPHLERWGAVALIAMIVTAAPRIVHESIAKGMMGMMFPLHAIPTMSLALVAWAVVSSRLGGALRRVALAAAILAGGGLWALLRTEGVTGEGKSQLAWRWTPAREQLVLARLVTPPAPPALPIPALAPGPALAKAEPKAAVVRVAAEWPGFRGPRRDSVVRGSHIHTGWATSPPVEMWRRAVGPGWSSFAIQGGLVYTQEQRGEDEVVACYKLGTGEPVWAHRDAARFWESNGGAGPRGTPAVSGDRVYALGATGILNALDAASGALVWTRNAATDTGAKIPGWGFSGSPLVVDDSVVVAASGRLAAYGVADGKLRWTASAGGGSYSSPQLMTLEGVPQLVMLSGNGATSVAPADGKMLWKHEWEGSTILQPALTGDGGLLITTGNMAGGAGTRRLAIARGPGGWTAEERWTSTGLKPYFNDLVVHNGHAFGFDGSILSCIDLASGSRKWKGGRYGHGQMLLLADQDLLLVLSEEGELALVAAGTEQFNELARFRAMEGKTWNHPALVGSTLLVRNGEEMVAFRMPSGGG